MTALHDHRTGASRYAAKARLAKQRADVSKDAPTIDTSAQPVRASSTFLGDSFSPPPAPSKAWEQNAHHARMLRLKKQIDEGYAVRSYEVEEVRQYMESLGKGDV